jgi:hypothetical protein
MRICVRELLGFVALFDSARARQQDSLPPTLTFKGANPLRWERCPDSVPESVGMSQACAYIDPGCTCLDSQGKDVPGLDLHSTLPEIEKPGTYMASYFCTDASGLQSLPAIRTIIVTDAVLPTLKVVGASPAHFKLCPQGAGDGPVCDYVDEGADCYDGKQKVLNAESTSTELPEMVEPGTFRVRYTCTDGRGLPAVPAARMVIVSAPEHAAEKHRQHDSAPLVAPIPADDQDTGAVEQVSWTKLFREAGGASLLVAAALLGIAFKAMMWIFAAKGGGSSRVDHRQQALDEETEEDENNRLLTNSERNTTLSATRRDTANALDRPAGEGSVDMRRRSSTIVGSPIGRR